MNHSVDTRYTKVADMITPSTNTWDVALVKSLFTPIVADIILCIPLAKSKPHDELVWGYEGNVYYSPKSGYRLLLELDTQVFRGSNVSSNNIDIAFFNNLWKLDVPSKCKIFFWRLFHNYLPTLSNLQQHRIQVGNACPFCAVAEDSIGHFLHGCVVSFQLFQSFQITLLNPRTFPDYKTWLTTLFNSLNKEQRTLVVIAYWALWFARNQLLHEGKRQSIAGISAFVSAHIAKLNVIAALRLPSTTLSPSSWSSPASGIIKFNFDTAFILSKKEAFSGVIARNSPGLILAACILPHVVIDDAFIAEARACEAVVNFTIELGFRAIHVEGDSLAVIKKLISPKNDKSIIRPIISDIQSKLGFFEKIIFSHVGRRGNEDAHVLTQAHHRFQLPRYWIEDAPLEVEQAALQDLRQ
ncbi:hypothetical protein V6N13_127065 [Hibiscus sabdariffa]|uniref:Reverse transcriptase zinc-binding domain n=1 Tax=Hibiscus sabdariffa TaxID=183260 RepID=A0ABR2RDX5_9ROSI